MSDKFFIDTNVLVYARDASQPEKMPVAQQWMKLLWDHSSGRISTQVLNEFYVTVTQKLSSLMTLDQARLDVEDLMAWQPLPVEGALIQEAISIQAKFKLSYWDSLIVAAAEAAECRYLVSEDLQHQQKFHTTTVINPFKTDPSSYMP